MISCESIDHVFLLVLFFKDRSKTQTNQTISPLLYLFLVSHFHNTNELKQEVTFVRLP